MLLNDTVYDLWLSRVPGVGNIYFSKLADCFGSARAVYENDDMANFGMVENLPKAVVEQIIKKRDLSEALAAYEKLTNAGITLTTYSSKNYPHNLKNIYDPAPILLSKGKNFFEHSGAMIAVVGTRKATAYGISAAKAIVRELSQSGITVVSGLALGIDAAAHSSALDSGGETIGVLGCGFNYIYPASNRALYERMQNENGMLLTEFMPEVAPIQSNFPVRNRIISGLCLGTLVVEASVHSGSLITASCALEQNREVYALPSNITSPSGAGANKLIKEGAHLVTGAEDILRDLFNVLKPSTAKPKEKTAEETADQKLTDEENAVYKTVLSGARNSEQVAIKLLKPISYINSVLTMLEIKDFLSVKMGNIFLNVR